MDDGVSRRAGQSNFKAGIFAPNVPQESIAEQNERRMSDCTLIWPTLEAVVGICPGFDDVLIWLAPETLPALAVPITKKVLDDLRNLIPLFTAHHRAYDKAILALHQSQIEWSMHIAQKVLGGEIKNGDALPKRPDITQLPEAVALRTLYDRVMKALCDFVARHEAQPEP